MPDASKTKTRKIKDTFGQLCEINEEALLGYAENCIDERFMSGEPLTSSHKTRQYLKLLIGKYEREVFYAIWLNSQHQVIKHGALFWGTIDGASIHPREVIKDGLACNAAAVIFAHNHPSGIAEPSQADIAITRRLKNCLQEVDIRTLDHVIVGNTMSSLAECGLM